MSFFFLSVFLSVFFFSSSLSFLFHSLTFFCCYSSFLFFTFQSWLVAWFYMSCMYGQGIAYLCACIHATQTLYVRCEIWVPSGGNHCIIIDCRDISFQFELCFKWLISWRTALQHFAHTHLASHIKYTHRNTSVWIDWVSVSNSTAG